MGKLTTARLWVALDVSEQNAAERLLEQIDPHRDVKVGMELFYRLGPDYVRELVQRGYHVFLDLKCHDIPETVSRAVGAVRDLGVEMLTVHAAGGYSMLNLARQSAGGEMALVAITALTSLDSSELMRLGLTLTVPELARGGAEVALAAGLAGVVTSAQEVEDIRHLWPGARIVVPGIRLSGEVNHDQRRTAEPAFAVSRGATDLVVGRSITRASDPKVALAHFLSAIGDETKI